MEIINNNNSLDDILKEVIRKEGPIPFERFMDMALYYPSLGYYASSRTNIGRKGDFYTSPHLHPVFGMVLARQIEECWTLLEEPKKFTVVEQGAGKGYLAHDILDYLRERELYDRLNYIIIEINPHVSDFQKELLKEQKHKIQLINDVKNLKPFEGCYISNELLDSFSVHLIQTADEVYMSKRKTKEKKNNLPPSLLKSMGQEAIGGFEGAIKEVYVGLRDNDFIEVLDAPSTSEINSYLEDFSISLAHGYRTEINLKIRDWLHGISEKMTCGFIVTVDYGYSTREYYDEDRNRGTLMCYFRHQVNENPFRNVGNQDITAHINFSAVKKWGEECGLNALGYSRQGTYMVSMGLDEIITERFIGKEDYQFEIAKIKGLIMPSAMGESHKVMVQYKGDRNIQLRGFSFRNRVNAL